MRSRRPPRQPRPPPHRPPPHRPPLHRRLPRHRRLPAQRHRPRPPDDGRPARSPPNGVRGTGYGVNHARVLQMEERAQLGLATWLRRRGRPVRVEPFPGVGANGLARVRGRVLVSVTTASTGPTRVPAWQPIRANLEQFLTVGLPGARVEIAVGDRTATAVADREGYLDVTLDGLTLTPGSHPATLTPVDPAGEPARGIVHVSDPAAALAVVSDIDDTIVDSGIAHGILATVTTALLRDAASRVPLTGAPELYRELARGATDGPPPPFFYLSTSPWNLSCSSRASWSDTASRLGRCC